MESPSKEEEAIIVPNESKDVESDNTQYKEEPILPQTQTKEKFYDHLQNVLKTQENILTSTTLAKEKLKYTNETSTEQIKNFKDNSVKYGKYLKQINEELHLICDLIKKIKQEIK